MHVLVTKAAVSLLLTKLRVELCDGRLMRLHDALQVRVVVLPSGYLLLRSVQLFQQLLRAHLVLATPLEQLLRIVLHTMRRAAGRQRMLSAGRGRSGVDVVGSGLLIGCSKWSAASIKVAVFGHLLLGLLVATMVCRRSRLSTFFFCPKHS